MLDLGPLESLAAVRTELLPWDYSGPTGRAISGVLRRHRRRGEELRAAGVDIFLNRLIEIPFHSQRVKLLKNTEGFGLVASFQALKISIRQLAHFIFKFQIFQVAVDDRLAIEQPVQFAFGQQLDLQVSLGILE
jgi:hypothetical protein